MYVIQKEKIYDVKLPVCDAVFVGIRLFCQLINTSMSSNNISKEAYFLFGINLFHQMGSIFQPINESFVLISRAKTDLKFIVQGVFIYGLDL